LWAVNVYSTFRRQNSVVRKWQLVGAPGGGRHTMVQPAQWLIGHSWYLTAEKATDSLVEGNSSLPPGLWLIPSVGGLPGWLRSTVGGTPVFGRRTDPVLRSTCSRRVITLLVNRPLQVSQLGQLSLSSFPGR